MVEGVHGGEEFREGAVVGKGAVGAAGLFGGGHLGSEPGFGFGGGQAAGEKAGEDGFARGGDAGDAVEGAVPAAFVKEGDDREPRAGKGSAPTVDRGADARVEDGFEARFGGGIGKDEGGHFAAVHGAVGEEEVRSERAGDFANGPAAGGGERVRHVVGVEHGHAEGGETGGGDGFSAGDATGQRGAERQKGRMLIHRNAAGERPPKANPPRQVKKPE